MEKLVLVEKTEHAAIITLNRPQSMNALSRDLMKELVSTFRALKNDDSIVAVILTGAGRAFCGGLDLRELRELRFHKSCWRFSVNSPHHASSFGLCFFPNWHSLYHHKFWTRRRESYHRTRSDEYCSAT